MTLPKSMQKRVLGVLTYELTEYKCHYYPFVADLCIISRGLLECDFLLLLSVS